MQQEKLPEKHDIILKGRGLVAMVGQNGTIVSMVAVGRRNATMEDLVKPTNRFIIKEEAIPNNEKTIGESNEFCIYEVS